MAVSCAHCEGQQSFHAGGVLIMVRFDTDIYRDWLDTSEVPELKIRGRFLEKFGFTVGTGVMVSVEHGRIIITLIPDTEDRQDS